MSLSHTESLPQLSAPAGARSSRSYPHGDAAQPARTLSAMGNDNRSRAWFENLFATHQQAILRYAQRRLDGDGAEDVVSSVFTHAWRHRDSLPDPALPWLYAAARYEVLRAYRTYSRSSRLTQRVGGLAETSRPLPDGTEQVHQNLSVEQLLHQLPDNDAEILRLSAWEQLSAKEIATVLDCPVTTVRMRLHHARRRAKKLWNAAHDLPTT